MTITTCRARVALILAMLTLAGTAACSPPTRTPDPVVPTGADGFYRPPDPVPAGSPGTLIRSQPYPAPPGYQAWRILYHSRDETGADRAVSGYVVVAAGAAPPGGRPIIAAGHPIVGLPADCAPSRAAHVPAAVARAAPLFAVGAAYVVSDYPGLGVPGHHPYLLGAVTGHAILDAARAATHLPGLHAGHQLILDGDTYGGQAALFAAQLVQQYAPDLHLLGVAAGRPAVQLPQLLAHEVNSTPYGVEFLLEAMAGYDGVTPDANLQATLTPTGITDLHLLTTMCTDAFAQATMGQLTTDVFRSDPLRTRPWADAFAAASPGSAPIPAPILITTAQRDNTGGTDILYPIDLINQYVTQICHQGDQVQYRTYPTLPHNGPDGATPADPDITQWILDRLAGKTAQTTCA